MSTAVTARPRARRAEIPSRAILAHAPKSWKRRLLHAVLHGVLLLLFAYAACGGQHLLYVLS